MLRWHALYREGCSFAYHKIFRNSFATVSVIPNRSESLRALDVDSQSSCRCSLVQWRMMTPFHFGLWRRGDLLFQCSSSRPRWFSDVSLKRNLPSSGVAMQTVEEEDLKPRSIYVGNLPTDINERELVQFLALRGCPSVKHLSMPFDVMRRADGVEYSRKRGYAFVRFESFEQATEAVEKTQGANCKGALLRVHLRHSSRAAAPASAAPAAPPPPSAHRLPADRSQLPPASPPPPSAALGTAAASSPDDPAAAAASPEKAAAGSPSSAAARAAPAAAAAATAANVAAKPAAPARLIQPKRSGRQVPANRVSARERAEARTLSSVLRGRADTRGRADARAQTRRHISTSTPTHRRVDADT